MDRASKSQIYTWKGITPPPSRCWAMTKDKMDALEAAGKIHWPKKTSGMPRLKLYPEVLPGVPLQDLWPDIPQLHNMSAERLGYPTQKPEVLLERVVKTSSNQNDLILDCFAAPEPLPLSPKSSIVAGLPATWDASLSTPRASACSASLA